MKTSARPCCRARSDCAVQISKSPFSNGIVFRTAPPASIGALVGKRIRWSGKCPKNMTTKYARPITSNLQTVGTILGLTFPLAHETHEVHERKSTKKGMKRYAVDLRLK